MVKLGKSVRRWIKGFSGRLFGLIVRRIHPLALGNDQSIGRLRIQPTSKRFTQKQYLLGYWQGGGHRAEKFSASRSRRAGTLINPRRNSERLQGAITHQIGVNCSLHHVYVISCVIFVSKKATSVNHLLVMKSSFPCKPFPF